LSTLGMIASKSAYGGGAEWLTQGIDYFNNPQTRSFIFSISLSH